MKRKPVFDRFRELDQKKINRDYQIHTQWTDGHHAPAEIIEKAEQAGLDSIAFTEHIRRESDYFKDFYKELDQLREKAAIEIFIGVESKVINDEGKLDISEPNYALAEIILGSVHRVPYKEGFVHPKELEKQKLFDLELDLSLAMVRAGKIHVLAHPAGMSVRLHGEFPAQYYQKLIESISKTAVAFELNSKYMNPAMFKIVIDLCRRYDPFVSIGSDVHKLEELGNAKKMVGAVL